MNRFFYTSLILALLSNSISAQDKEEELDDLVESYQFHKRRLEGDIEHLQKKLAHYKEHPWLPEEIRQRVLLKKESLGALAGGAAQDTKAETMLEILAEQGRSGGFEKRSRGDKTGMELMKNPTRIGIIYPKKQMVKRIDTSIMRYLGRRGPIDYDELISKVGKLKAYFAVDHVIDHSAALSKSIASVKIISKLPASDFYNSVMQLSETFASDIEAEIYENPDEVSKTWLKEANLMAIAPLEKEKLAVQLKRQQALLSKEDKALTSAERRKNWEEAKSVIFKLYHSPEVRKLAIEKHREQLERQLEYRDSFLENIKYRDDRKAHFDEKETELAQYFGVVRLQGHTNSCTAFALLDSMQWLGAPSLSTAYAHSLASAASILRYPELTAFPSRLSANLSQIVNKTGDDLIDRMDRPSSDPTTYERILKLGIPEESAHPFMKKNGSRRI